MKFIVIALLLWCGNALAETHVGRIFALGEPHVKPLFMQTTRVERSADGVETWTSRMLDAGGQLVMTESATLKGSRVIRQRVDQFQTHESYELEIKDSKVEFLTFDLTASGNRELRSTKTESNSEPVLSGPATGHFVDENWLALERGETIEARFAVLELGKTVAFRFSRKSSSPERMVVEMKPSSFFLRLLVAPIEITFDAKTHEMSAYKGRTPMRVVRDGESKPFDGEADYQNGK